LLFEWQSQWLDLLWFEEETIVRLGYSIRMSSGRVNGFHLWSWVVEALNNLEERKWTKLDRCMNVFRFQYLQRSHFGIIRSRHCLYVSGFEWFGVLLRSE
jgi:hypothetical protein